jgi:hypothetical protein
MYRDIIEEFTSPEDAFLHKRWAPITPMIVFGMLYLLAREVKIEINIFYFLLIYATASYSAWTWGKTIKTQKEITGQEKQDKKRE